MSISIFNEGNYLIKNIVDNGSYIGYTSDTFKYVKDIQPNALLTQKNLFVTHLKLKFYLILQVKDLILCFILKTI